MKAASPEFALLLTCCRWPRDATVIEAVERLATGPLDWDRFQSLVARHRVASLVQDVLKRDLMPTAVRARFDQAGAFLAKEAMLHVSESLRLKRLLAEAAIPAMFIKGASLGVRAYGSLALKHSRDIDLLVPPEHIHETLRLLEGEGYVMNSPRGLSPVQLERFMGLSRECEMVHPTTGMVVEPHWRLLCEPSPFSGFPPKSARQEIAIGKAGFLPTLADPELYAYLCLQGAHHAWFRLKWLADLAALAAGGDICALHRAACRLGAGRASGQALLLARRFLGLRLPAGLEDELLRDPGVRRLQALGVWGLTGPERGPENLPAMLSDLLLVEGWAERRAVIGRQWRGDWDRIHIPLPAGLAWLYPVLRIPSWLIRHAIRFGSRPRD